MSVNISSPVIPNKSVSFQKLEDNANKNVVSNPVVSGAAVQNVGMEMPSKYPTPVIQKTKMPPQIPVFRQDIAAKVGETIFTTTEKLSNLGENSEVESKAMDFLNAKLSQNKGVVVGDANHSCDLTPNFLARNMESLKENNVKQLYLEYFRPENQPALDRYFEKGDNISELGEILVKQSPDAYLNPLPLVQKAKENGIRCFGINEKGTPIERNKAWGETVAKNSQNLKDNEKYLLMCGSGHLQGGMDFKFKDGNSIEEILKVPALRTSESIIRTNSDKIFEYNKYNQMGDSYAQLVFPEKLCREMFL